MHPAAYRGTWTSGGPAVLNPAGSLLRPADPPAPGDLGFGWGPAATDGAVGRTARAILRDTGLREAGEDWAARDLARTFLRPADPAGFELLLTDVISWAARLRRGGDRA